MTFTAVGRSGLALLLGPSGVNNYPQFYELDTGSQRVTTATSGVSAAVLEKAIGTFDNSTIFEITNTADWGVTELSGTTIFGFGLKTATGESGADWVVINFANTGSINFAGQKELQIQTTMRVVNCR